jgi:cbb3-type cytochrome oxidase cytochrome c subunit
MKFSRNTTFLLCLIVFVVAFGGLALISWNHLKEPFPLH